LRRGQKPRSSGPLRGLVPRGLTRARARARGERASLGHGVELCTSFEQEVINRRLYRRS